MDPKLAVRRRMLIQHEIDKANNRLIAQMRKLVDDAKLSGSRMEKHQIGNLLEVATETDSVELLKNFVQYQIGRDVGGNSWRAQSFGDNLVKFMDNELREAAKHSAADVESAERVKLSDAELKSLTDEIWIQLARQFIGQMNRYFYYRKEAQRWNRP